MQPRAKPAPPPNKKPIFIAAAAMAIAIWLLWPSTNVANLDSQGSSIVAFGDSLTAGYGARPGEDYPSKLAALINRPVINAGQSGDTTAGALERVEDDVLAHDPKIVIVGLGGNDFLRGEPLATTEQNLRAIVREIQANGAMVVLLGFRFPSLQADYADMYERVADDERCLLIPGVLAGILTDPALKSDEIHPNARGYALMADRIEAPLAKLLERTSP